MDVFISWTGADRDVKDVLAEKLQAAGITCWDSDEYCTSDYAEECTAAIRRCGVFIAIISDASMEKGFVQNEVTTARTLEREGKLNILVYKITEKPYTDAFEFLLNHISFVTGNVVQRGENGLDIIVNRAKTLLRKRKEGNPEKPFDVHIPEIDGLRIAKTGYFVEGSRDESLQVIEESLQNSNVLILTEFFGFGKRSTVKKFVETHREQYRTAIMVPNKHDSLRDFFLAGLEFTNINGKTFENLQGDALLKAKIKILEKLDADTLLVIPDVKFEDRPDPYLCELLGSLHCRIILLTQESADAYVDWFPVIPIGRMRDEYLYELFFHHYVRAYDEEKEALQEPLSRFFANIGGHTKTVELTAATLNRDLRVSPEDLPQYLSMQGSEGLQMKDRIIRQIESVFDVEQLEEDEIIALLIAAYLAVPYISEKTYRTVLESCGVQDWEMVIELDKRRWLDLDVQNRTVAVEPLVAQIILSKFPEQYEIMNLCMDHLADACGKMFSISSSESTLLRGLGKMEYFLKAVDLPECARIATLVNRASIEGNSFDVRLMAEAVQQLEAKYPAVLLTDEEALSGRDILEQNALSFIRQILPLAKLISRDMAGLMLDFSAVGNRIMEISEADGTLGLNTVELLGLSYEECMALLSELRQDTEEMDKDSYEGFVLMECFALLDSLMKRDMSAVMMGLESLIAQVERYPQILTSEDCADTVFAVLQMLGRIYIGSGAYSSAIMLCEKLLAYPMPQLKKAVVLNVYLVALRCRRLYTQTLYDAYGELLQIYESNAKDVFDTRSDVQREKKAMLLQFAEDLANGEQTEDAQRRFAEAWKIKNCFLPDPEAHVANTLVDALVKTGQFEQAVSFINAYFTDDTMEAFLSDGNDKTQEIIRTFRLYKNAGDALNNDFADDTDPRKYVSYYHTFSRKNNSLLEQKYLSVADQALDYDFSELTDDEIARTASRLKQRAKKEKMLQLAPEAFALASEAGYRILGYRHHYVQYMGAAAMADGKIAEILNGEGKTYTIVLTAFLHWLYGKQVFVVDQSPYLTGRNYNWMQGVYALLGVQCRHIARYSQMPGKMGSVIYTDLNTLVFAYMYYEQTLHYTRNAMALDTVIVDEIDTSLVDGAAQPYSLVSSKMDKQLVRIFETAWELSKEVLYDETYYTYTNGNVVLTPAIYPLIEHRFAVSYGDVFNLENLRKIENAVTIGILCCGHYEKGKDYHIHNGTPVLESREKGVFEPIHVYYRYFLCKENDLDTCSTENELSQDKITNNSIGIRDLFRKFRTVCGTTATAVSFRKEFRELYDLDYIAVPPHCPCIRQDYQSPVYLTMRAKDQAILEMVKEKAAIGQPILLVTQSVAESEKYDRLLKRNGIDHKLLNAKNAEEYSGVISWAGVPSSVLVTNALAGRGADIKLGGDPELRTRRELVELGENVSALDDFLYRLPSPEQKASSLYQKYYSILEKNKALCSDQKQMVVDAGGLCVIGTGFFPEPRTEQQTRGRSGRQGQVGESWVFRSLEDDGLRALLSASMVEWVLSTCQGVEELNVSFLNKALKNAQQNLHESRFSRIRKQNGVSHYIDQARQAFIGKRFDLSDGIITPEDLLEDWASDKFVLQNLQALQKGEPCQIPALKQLSEQYEMLRIAKGSKAPLILSKVLQDELDRIFAGLGDRKSDTMIEVLCTVLLNSWKAYINIVQNTVGSVTMKENAMERYLEDEKNRLLRKVVEDLLTVKIKK